MTDLEIIRACKKCDRKAQKAFVEKFTGYIFSICIRYVGNPTTAKDLTQDCLVQILNNVTKYEEKGSLNAWISTVTVRKCLDHLKYNKKRQVVELVAERHDSPETNLSRLELDDLLHFLNQLPEKYRTVLNLYSIEGYSHKEIAESLKINESSSRSLVSRARSMLKKHLALEEKRLNKIVS